MAHKHDDETTVSFKSSASNIEHFKHLELFYRGRVHIIPPENMPYTVGRDTDKCQLILKDKLVSRQHFCLEVRDGLVGISDQSTNGTWVKLGRAESVTLKNRFLPLVGSGVIKPGSEIEENNINNLHFKVINKLPD